jgi:hypothetical protein
MSSSTYSQTMDYKYRVCVDQMECSTQTMLRITDMLFWFAWEHIQKKKHSSTENAILPIGISILFFDSSENINHRGIWVSI